MPIFKEPNCASKTIALISGEIILSAIIIHFTLQSYGLQLSVLMSLAVLLILWYVIDNFPSFFLTDSKITKHEKKDEKQEFNAESAKSKAKTLEIQ